MNIWLRLKTFAAPVKHLPWRAYLLSPSNFKRAKIYWIIPLKIDEFCRLKSLKRFVSNNVEQRDLRGMTSTMSERFHQTSTAYIQKYEKSIANAKAYRSSCTRCAAIREPDAPRGWPTASAPPSTLVRSRGRPSSFSTAKYWAANACRQMEYCSVRVHRTSTYYEYIVLVSVENWVSGIRAL